MKLTEYFIRHKVPSIILNMMILIIGFLCLKNISVREYPEVKIPVFSISTYFHNASASTVESSVTNVLEDAVSGVAGVKNIKSFSQQNSSHITATFNEGVNTEKAMIDLQNAVNTAKSQLPRDLQAPEIKSGGQYGGIPFFAISMTSSEMDHAALGHYVERYVKNNFRSISGVASANVWAPTYTMRISLDNKKLYAYGINVSDVITALSKYDKSLPVGKFREITPTTLDVALEDPEEFAKTAIITKNNRVIYISDIATTELSINSDSTRIHINGEPGIMLEIQKTSDANPIDVAAAIRKTMDKVKLSLPEHMKLNVSIDQSEFINSSLDNIYKSIAEAIFLVLVIVYLFLRNIRATIIPLVTIPFSMIGSIAIMQMCGMSINTLTLLAMVLAIGLVVDDAIVMLENITRHIEEGMKPFDAAIKGSSEIAFAIVAMTLTLASVYAPIAFVEGVIGQLFIEFAVALAGSVLISGIVALTLSPMMCSRILKLSHDDSESRMHKLLLKVDAKYASILHKVLHMPKLIIGVVIGSVILSYGLIKIMPPEIVPKEDRGLFGVWIGPIPGESMDDMETHSAVVEKILFKIPEAKEFLTFMGSWGSSTCVNLKDFSKRSRSQEQIKTSINSIVSQIPSLDAYPWSSDSGLPGMEISVEGNNLSMAVSTTGSYQELSKYAEKMVGAMNGSGKFMYAYHDVKFNTAGYDLIFDRDKLASLQIDPQAVSDTVGVFFSGNRNLRFHKEDVGYSVTIDGEQKPWSLDELYITDSAGNRISIGSFAKLEETINMANLPHYNQMRAATISGAMLPFVSIESIMPDIMQLAQDTFPKSYKIEWTGAAQIAKESTGKVALMFIMAIIFIYAILSVQFDNFLDPFVIMTTVPLACSGGLLTSWFFGQSFNIYTQIGLITLVGLITKHGILIVDFANKVLADHHPSMRGDPVLNNASAIEQAVTRGAITRLRPILMTTGAMILGSFPLVFSSGAGSEARTAIGIVIVGGLGFGTFFTLFVLPRIYCWVKGFAMRNYH